MKPLTRKQIEELKREHETVELQNFIRTNCLSAFDLYIDKIDESLKPPIEKYGFWEAWITSWFTNNVTHEDVVFDIGANCGYYTMLCVALNAKTYAFEPLKKNYEALMRTRKFNNADFEIFNIAIANRVGQATLSTRDNLFGSSSMVFDIGSQQEIVDVNSLDNLRDQGYIEQPSLIKMDIEGAEELAWQGALDVISNTKTVVLEWTPKVYSQDFNDQIIDGRKLTYIDFAGKEQDITTDELNSKEDFTMIVSRKSKP